MYIVLWVRFYTTKGFGVPDNQDWIFICLDCLEMDGLYFMQTAGEKSYTSGK